MSPKTQIIGIMGTALMLALVIELVRRRRLRIGYSLLWLLVGTIALALILFRGVVGNLAHLIGIESPTSLLFTAGIAFAFLILLEHSLTLTILWRQNKGIAQHQALLEHRVRQLQARLDALAAANEHPETWPETQAPAEQSRPWWEHAALAVDAPSLLHANDEQDSQGGMLVHVPVPQNGSGSRSEA